FDIPIGDGRRGVANLSVSSGAMVWGVLYLLKPEQHEHLDRTEGVPNGLYRRLRIEVECAGELLVAETLISERRDPSRLPSFRYRELILDGAREHGLPEDWVRTLEAWRLAWDERDGAFNPPDLAPD